MFDFDIQKWRHYAHRFDREGVCIIPHPLKAGFADLMEEEVHDLLQRAQRREMCIAESGNTPRAYHSVSRNEIHQYDGYIRRLFESNDILTVFSYVAGEPIHRVPFEPEEYIINSQSTVNDTHGWHWDDYTYALIYCIDEPDPMSDARIEYIADTKWNKDDPESSVRQALLENTVQSFHLKKHHCYFMKSNTTMHRVSAMTSNSKRTVIVMTFASTSDLTDKSITHESMNAIYPETAYTAI